MNKKYFVAIYAVFGIQLGLGVNSAIAVPCETEMNAVIEYLKEINRKNNTTYVGAFVPYNFITDTVFTSPNDFWPNLKELLSKKLEPNNSVAENVDHFRQLNKMAREKAKNGSYEPLNLEICYTQAMVDANADIDAIIKGNKASKSSSSGTSTQAKSNQQATKSQTPSSDPSDESKKKLNEAIDQSNNAHDNKDYAKSIAAIKIILADSKDIPLKAAATNRLAEYYKYGNGVQKDEVKAQALFEQASLAGDPDADAHICENYEDGTGGVTKNHQTAIKYCTFAANKGHVIAMGKLGYIYHTSEGVKNPQLGNEWICKAAKQGNSNAISNAEKLKLNCN